MIPADDAFTRFEHSGWERVATKYEGAWSSLTRQFIPSVLQAANILPGLRVLDVACGPGYAAAGAKDLGADVEGSDFSATMVALASRNFPGIKFHVCSADSLPFDNHAFDRLIMNFGILHLAQPEKACAEACRVLKKRGRFCFSLWTPPDHNEGARIMENAIQAHADLSVGTPVGPPKFLFTDSDRCREVLQTAGFDPTSMTFDIVTVGWNVPTSHFLFDAERDAGVRTAGVLALQSPERLEAIRLAVEEGVKRYAHANGFTIPMTAHIISASKS